MKNKKGTAIFLSLIPGAGHMYLGFQKQGIQLMAAFFLSCYLHDLLNIDLILVVPIIIWFYSIFDVRYKASSEALPDDQGFTIHSSNFPLRVQWEDHGNLIGYALLLVGVLALLHNVVLPLLNIHLSWEIRHYIKGVFTSLVFIALGFTLLFKGSKKRI